MGKVYRYVEDNNGSICDDNNGNQIYVDFVITGDGVVVRQVKNGTYPCLKCRHWNNMKFPNTNVHLIAVKANRYYLSNLKAGQDQPYIEEIGECLDFEEKTGRH